MNKANNFFHSFFTFSPSLFLFSLSFLSFFHTIISFSCPYMAPCPLIKYLSPSHLKWRMSPSTHSYQQKDIDTRINIETNYNCFRFDESLSWITFLSFFRFFSLFFLLLLFLSSLSLFCFFSFGDSVSNSSEDLIDPTLFSSPYVIFSSSQERLMTGMEESFVLSPNSFHTLILWDCFFFFFLSSPSFFFFFFHRMRKLVELSAE